MTQEEKRNKLRALYKTVVEEIDIMTNSKAEDVRIEQIKFYPNNNIKECIVSFLLKIHDASHSAALSVFQPKYERVYKKINLNSENEVTGLLLFEMS